MKQGSDTHHGKALSALCITNGACRRLHPRHAYHSRCIWQRMALVTQWWRVLTHCSFRVEHSLGAPGLMLISRRGLGTAGGAARVQSSASSALCSEREQMTSAQKVYIEFTMCSNCAPPLEMLSMLRGQHAAA